MWLVRRNDPRPGPQAIEIPEIDSEALRAAYAGCADKQDVRRSVDIVRRAQQFGYWIACDCRQTDDVFPLIAPAYLTTAGTYYLRRLTGGDRHNHNNDCLFRFDRPVPGLGPMHHGRQGPITAPTGLFSVLSPEDADRIAVAPITSSSKSTSLKGPPPLARQLWRIMEIARLNRLEPVQRSPKPSIKIEFSKIKVLAERLEVHPKTALTRVLATHPNDYHSRKLFARIRTAATQWPEDTPLQGFLLAYTHDLKSKALLFHDVEPILIAGELSRPSGGDPASRGPYLTLVVVGEHAAASGLTALRAYAQPIYSGSQFVPVESGFERRVLKTINSVRWSLSKSNAALEVSLEKPVFDRQTPDGLCRPDFILEILDNKTGEIRNVVIEAIGFEMPDYTAAKMRMRPSIMHIGPVLECRPSDIADGGEFLRSLTDLIVG